MQLTFLSLKEPHSALASLLLLLPRCLPFETVLSDSRLPYYVELLARIVYRAISCRYAAVCKTIVTEPMKILV